MTNKELYLDYVSSTPVDPTVLDTYLDLVKKYYANSDSIHDLGMEVNRFLTQARMNIAKMLNVRMGEIIFTSGASESNNLAIKGIAFKYQHIGKHIITTKIEHSSVLNSIKQLENEFGFEVTYLDVNEKGVILLSDLKSALKEDTILVSIMAINNEIGSRMPIDEIKKIVKKNKNAFLHVDCVQALGKYPLDLTDIDLASFSAHKIHGLKGSGILVKKQHVSLLPMIVAGQQEQGLRGGTSNALVNIVFSKTLRIALEKQEEHFNKVKTIQDYLKTRLKEIDDVSINSSDEASVYIVNISVNHITSEVLMNALNQSKIYVSAASTCASKENAVSYVLSAINLPLYLKISAIRIGLSYEVDKEDIDYFINELKEIVKKYGK